MAEESYQHRIMRFLNEMPFESQKKAQRLYMAVIIAVAVVSYAIADICQQFSICVYSTLAAMVVCYFVGMNRKQVVVPGQAPWWRQPLPPFQPEAEKIKNKKD